MAEERGLTVDVKGFDDAMEEARERSRSAHNKVYTFLVKLHPTPPLLISFEKVHNSMVWRLA